MEKIHNTKEAAEILEVSYYTCLDYIHSGKLKAVKLGDKTSRYRIKDSDLREFMDKGGSHERTKSEDRGTESLPELDERAGS